jgi:hypothetical protein
MIAGSAMGTIKVKIAWMFVLDYMFLILMILVVVIWIFNIPLVNLVL